MKISTIFWAAADSANGGFILFLLVAILIYLQPIVSIRGFASFPPEHFMDFRVDWVSGKIALSADRSRLYDSEVQQKWFNATASPHPVPVSYFPYAPVFLIFTIPLSLLPLNQACLLWLIATCMFGLVGLVLLHRSLVQERKANIAILILAAVSSLPAARCLILGQMSFLFLGLLSVYFYGLIKKNDLAIALALAFSSIKPQFLVFLVIPLLAEKRFRAIALSTAMILLVVTIIAIVSGSAPIFSYPSAFATMVSHGHQAAHPEEMICVKGVLTELLCEPLLSIVTYTAMLAGIISIFLLWIRRAQYAVGTEPWLIAATVLIYLLTSPHVHLYDCLLISIPAVLTLTSTSFSRARKSMPVDRRCWELILILYPVVGWTLYFLLGDNQPWLFRLLTAIVILMLFLCLTIFKRINAAHQSNNTSY